MWKIICVLRKSANTDSYEYTNQCKCVSMEPQGRMSIDNFRIVNLQLITVIKSSIVNPWKLSIVKKKS
jgi:hypothetical protein